MVYVINYDGQPLMPCSQAIARLLLKQGKAKCIKRTPFTIKLLYQTTNYTQDITLGVDTGSGKKSILEIVRHFKQISTYRIWRQNNNHLILKNNFGKRKHFGVMDISLVVLEM